MKATATLAGATPTPLTKGTFRVTEYTVGDRGPQAMPGTLPPLSGCTYASEFTIDEAKGGAVAFDRPVVAYLDNFLAFPVGTTIPAGAYEADRGAWSPGESGKVVKVVADGASLGLDATGDGVPDPSDPAELLELAKVAKVGDVFWRVPLRHFSPWDLNLGFSPRKDAQQPPPGTKGGANGTEEPQTCQGGSWFECENQVLGETLPIVGTGLALTYRSDRVRGRASAYTVRVPVFGATVPPEVTRATVTVTILGRQFVKEYTGGFTPNLEYVLVWDGKDKAGHDVAGQALALVTVGYASQGVYEDSPLFGFASTGVPVSTGKTREEVVLSRDSSVLVGLWDPRGLGYGGWSLDQHHVYDADSHVLYPGNGPSRSARSLGLSLYHAGGDPAGAAVDGEGALGAVLARPARIIVLGDGTVLATEQEGHRVRKIDPGGKISTFAGTGTEGFGGDGGLATSAQLSGPMGIVKWQDDICIADRGNRRVRCVDGAGKIRTVLSASGGELPISVYDLAVGPEGDLTLSDYDASSIWRFSHAGKAVRIAGGSDDADDVMATEGNVSSPRGLAYAADGTLYVASWGGDRVRAIGPNGRIRTIVGSAGAGGGGDGFPAVLASINGPQGLATDEDGSLYIADLGNARVRKIDPNGTITTVAGGGARRGPRVSAKGASLSQPEGVAVGPDGAIWVTDGEAGRVYRLRSPLPEANVGDVVIPSEDGASAFVFDEKGRHLRTVETLTGTTVLTFGYDAAGRLVSATDAYDNQVKIARDAAGRATAVTAPFAQTTKLTYDGAGYLASLNDPLGRTTTLTYDTGGLLTKLVDPRQGVHTMSYDAVGLLAKDAGPAGASWSFARKEDASGYAVTVTTTAGVQRTHKGAATGPGEESRSIVHADGTTTAWIKNDEGRETTMGDGTVTKTELAADERFGTLTPYAAKTTATLPSGLTRTVERTRQVVESVTNPLALASVEETTSEEGDTFSRSFDGPNRTWTTKSPEGRTVRTTVDDHGRPVRTEVAEVIPVALTYDGRGRIEGMKQGVRSLVYAYDAVSGYLASVTDATSRKVLYQRDAAARPTSVTGPDEAKLLLAFDAHDNVTSVTPPGKGAHAFAYTADDRESAYTPPKSAATTTYDADRRPFVTTRPDGSTWTRGYDAAGRLSSFAYPGAALTPTYDDKGHLTAVAGPGAESLQAGYDGPLVTSLSTTGVATGTVAWTHDTRFRANREEVNGAHAVDVFFDGDGLPTDIGSLALTREATTGRLSEAIVSYGVTTSFAYSPFGEVASAVTKAGDTTVLDLAFTYDVLGRIVEKKDTGVVWSYGYDLAGRLSSVKKDGSSVAMYTYDANGNRLNDNATYDEEDRQLTGDGATFAYTPNGERRTRVDAGGMTTYGYDGRGHLTSVVLPTGKAIAYGLDALGRRVSRSEDGVITHRWLFRSQLQPVAEVDAGGGVTTRYVYGTKVNVPDYFERGGATYAVLTDQLGSVRKVVDASSGEVVQEMAYDAWGVVTLDTNPGFQPFGFAGGVWEAATGLVHFGAREYEPATGRWTRRDPVGFGGGSAGLYGYVGARPATRVDPDGRRGVAVSFGGSLGLLLGGQASFGFVWDFDGSSTGPFVSYGGGLYVGAFLGGGPSATYIMGDVATDFRGSGSEAGIDLPVSGPLGAGVAAGFDSKGERTSHSVSAGAGLGVGVRLCGTETSR